MNTALLLCKCMLSNYSYRHIHKTFIYDCQLDTRISCSFTQITLNSCTCFERNPLIIRRSSTQIVHMQPLVSSLSANDHLVQPLKKESFISGCTRRSLAESDDTRGCICTICVVDLLMMSGLRSKHVEEFILM